MYSKRLLLATLTLTLFGGCVSVPWKNEPVGQEVNLAFTVSNNLLYVTTATVDGRPGRFLVGSAQARTVLDKRFAERLGAGRHLLQLNERESIPFSPVLLDLQGIADGIIGADVWGSHAVSIDFRSGLVTYQKEGIHPALMTLYTFTAEPRINVEVDGRRVPAIVDTTSPDTLVLPGGNSSSRASARLQIAGTDFGTTDVRRADVATARVGNRLLSKFLVTIDYGRREVGLWRDPRIP